MLPSLFKITDFWKISKPKILFVSPEAAPFVRVGGLGEVMKALPKALKQIGCDTRLMMPKYALIDNEKYPIIKEAEGLNIFPKDQKGIFVCNVLKYQVAKDGEPIVYFLENQEFYEKRANVYGYSDDPVRWALLCRGVLEFLKISEWRPDVIICSDWQTGFLPNLLKTEYRDDKKLYQIAILFSIHNLHYQGMFDHKFVAEMDYDAGQQAIPDLNDERILKLNGMRRGIMYADAINTVSSAYAQEILKLELGEGLDELLKEKRSRLFGILNGIDYDVMNPETDLYLKENYSVKNFMERREANKLALQKHFDLPEDKNKFVIGIVSRMDEQKGFDLIMEVADALFSNVDFQMIVLGGGDNKYRLFFQDLEKRYPKRIAGHFMYDAVLPRMIFAGSDAILIPSRFEPCGLVQMEAMRYGAIPIVRKVGGLADSVVDFDPQKEEGTGFVFENFDSFALLVAIIRAKETFRNKKEWHGLVGRAMKQDFSWQKSAEEYARLCNLAMTFKKEEKTIKDLS